jgi:hypothetical protein
MPEVLLQIATLVAPTGRGGWFFTQDLPPIWQWISFVVAIIALVLAMITIPQLLFGAPKPRSSFERTESDGDTSLLCVISNKPVSKRGRRFVRREAVEITASLSIFDEGTKLQIAQTLPDLFMHDRTHARIVRLTASHMKRPFVVVAQREKDGRTYVASATPIIELNYGSYVAHILVELEGDVRVWTRRFVAAKDRLYWF